MSDNEPITKEHELLQLELAKALIDTRALEKRANELSSELRVSQAQTAQLTSRLVRRQTRKEDQHRESLTGQVSEFHREFGYPVRRVPAVCSREEKALRRRLISEEVNELAEAITMNDLPAIADGIADLMYVLEGTALTYGIDMAPVLALVHAANMAKRGGPVVDGKLRKPPGWTPPDVAGELERQGWKP